MKVMEEIIFADSLRPNAFTAEQKLVWLNELEGRIQSRTYTKALPCGGSEERTAYEVSVMRPASPDDFVCDFF